jgi:serine/threonine-protein kinase
MPPDPATVNLFVPQAISAAIMRALAKEPGLRFQSAVEFQAALQDLGRITGAAPVTPSTVASSSELADLEARLSRAIGPIAKRLVADAARRYGSISEIRQALASQIGDPKEREAFLKTDPGATVTMASRDITPHISFDPSLLDRLTQALAMHLGPIAKVVVTRAARTARSAEELQDKLAVEIPSAADRQRFLAAVRSGV